MSQGQNTPARNLLIQKAVRVFDRPDVAVKGYPYIGVIWSVHIRNSVIVYDDGRAHETDCHQIGQFVQGVLGWADAVRYLAMR